MEAVNTSYDMQAVVTESTSLPFASKIEAFLCCLEINWEQNVFEVNKIDAAGNARSILLATTMQGMEGLFSCSSAYHFDKFVYVTFLVMSNTCTAAHVSKACRCRISFCAMSLTRMHACAA